MQDPSKADQESGQDRQGGQSLSDDVAEGPSTQGVHDRPSPLDQTASPSTVLDEAQSEVVGGGEKRAAFLSGLAAIISTSSIVLVMSFIGFGALSREAGLSGIQTLFTTLTVFALPGQVVLVDQVLRDASLLAVAFAVTLTAIRLMPLTASLIPYFQSAQVPKWQQYIFAHFIAVTVWSESMRRLPNMHPDLRAAYYSGFVTALMLASLIGTGSGLLYRRACHRLFRRRSFS